MTYNSDVENPNQVPIFTNTGMGPDYDFEPSSYSIEEKLKVLLQREERRILANAVNNGQIIFTDEEAQTIENIMFLSGE